MAGSFSSGKVVAKLITRAINNGRGFASAAPRGVVSGMAKGGAPAGMVKKTGKEVAATQKVSWVPDPRTGFYRPENVAEEIDVAELRAVLLKKH